MNGVGVYCVKDGKILVGCRDDGRLCGPGGHIEKGESPESAAEREAREEFGIVPKNLVYFGRGARQNNGFEPYLFLCTEWEGDIKTDDVEMFCPAFRSVEEIENNSNLFPPFAYGCKKLVKDLKVIDAIREKHKDGAPIGNKNAAGPHDGHGSSSFDIGSKINVKGYGDLKVSNKVNLTRTNPEAEDYSKPEYSKNLVEVTDGKSKAVYDTSKNRIIYTGSAREYEDYLYSQAEDSMLEEGGDLYEKYGDDYEYDD